MKINISIERLILDGISIPHHQRPSLQLAVETGLARLIKAGGLSSSLMSGGAKPGLGAGEMQLPGDGDPAQLGQRLARAVYAGIGDYPAIAGGSNSGTE
ncbi:MAG: hypothetical protein IPM66_10645 [Acidobacteriota bacterium]|nr:MAG: hypothetical protein IPM66_10645 [Acidobacteriota bacterium]